MSEPSKQRRMLAKYGEMFGDVMWSYVSDFLILLSQMASFYLLSRQLPLERYGGYVGLYGVVGPIGALSWAGLALLIMQRIVREKADPDAVGRMALTLLIIQGLLASGVSYLIASQIIDAVNVWAIVGLIVVDLMVAPVAMVTAALRQAIVGFPSAARVRMGLVLLRALALISLWAGSQLTLVKLSIAWIVVLGGYALYCLAVLWPRMGLTVRIARLSRSELKTNFQLSLPLASSNLQRDGDKAVLNSFNYAADAGVYGAAFRLVWMAQMPIQSMNSALFHRFLSNDEGVTGQHVGRAKKFTIVSVAVSVVFAVVLYVGAPLAPWALGDKFAEVTDIIRILCFFLPLSALSRAPLNGLLGLNATTARAVLVLSAAALSMVLYIALIPSMSWRGAVVGTLIGEAFLGLAGWLTLIRLERRADSAIRANVLWPLPAHRDPNQVGGPGPSMGTMS